jgi:hypothetical protein
MREGGAGADSLGIGAGVLLAETGRHCTLFTVEKWDLDQVAFARRKIDRTGHRLPSWEPGARDFTRLKVRPFETYRLDDANLIVNAGWVMLMNGVAGSAVTKFSATVGRIGLGTSATAVAYGDTALNAIGALTSKNWELCGAAPTIGSGSGSGNGLLFSATFPTGDANTVAIQEFAVDSGTASTLSASAVAPMLSHGNATPGTKTSSQVWNATVAVTWT